MFDMVDKNKDGVIDQDEYLRLHERVVEDAKAQGRAEAKLQHKLDARKRWHRRFVQIISGLVALVTVSMGLNFAMSKVAVDLAKDTSVDPVTGMILLKGTNTPAMVENPHISTSSAHGVSSPVANLADGRRQEVLVGAQGDMLAVAPLTDGAGGMVDGSGRSVATDTATHYRFESNGLTSLLSMSDKALDTLVSMTVEYVAGGKVKLHANGWEKRTLQLTGGNGFHETGSGESGSGFYETGSGESGSHTTTVEVLVVRTTHPRFSSLFTLRVGGPDAVATTQLVRAGSPEQEFADMILYANESHVAAQVHPDSTHPGRRRLNIFSAIGGAITTGWNALREELENAVDELTGALTDLGGFIEEIWRDVERLVEDVGAFASAFVTLLHDALISLGDAILSAIRGAVQLWTDTIRSAFCISPACQGSHINSGTEMVLIGPAHENPTLLTSSDLQVTALTTLSACFEIYDIELELGDISQFLSDFFTRNPVIELVQSWVDQAMAPINSAVDALEIAAEAIKNFFEGLSLPGRRLEEVPHAEIKHYEELTRHARRHLQTAEGVFEHFKSDFSAGGSARAEEGFVRDVHAKMEQHMRQRQLQGEMHQLISLSSLKATVSMELNSRLLIEATASVPDKYSHPQMSLPIESKSFDNLIQLPSTPFALKLAGSFSVSVGLNMKITGSGKALLHVVANGVSINFDLGSSDAQPLAFELGDWSGTELKMLGHASVSAELLVKVQASLSMSLCIGGVCGGVQALGFWEAAKGVDMGISTTHANGAAVTGVGLDADGCRQWTFESKLTNYAEYPLEDQAVIEAIRAEAGGGFALMGGHYQYMTVPYLRVLPVFFSSSLPTTSCALQLVSQPLFTFAGPNDCTTVDGTCQSPKTQTDTMKDQGWHHPYGAMLHRTSAAFGHTLTETSIYEIGDVEDAPDARDTPGVTSFCSERCEPGTCRLVTPEDIMYHRTSNMEGQPVVTADANGGARIVSSSAGTACDAWSEAVSYVGGPEWTNRWTRIRYTTVYEGYAACWGIHGNWPDTPPPNSGWPVRRNDLHALDQGAGDVFDADWPTDATYMCNNAATNFWHVNNEGASSRRATVELRRRNTPGSIFWGRDTFGLGEHGGVQAAGLGTRVNCVVDSHPPSWTYSDIHVCVGIAELHAVPCTCKDSWSFMGSTWEGCANPGNDPSGTWCESNEGAGCLDPSGEEASSWWFYCDAPSPPPPFCAGPGC